MDGIVNQAYKCSQCGAPMHVASRQCEYCRSEVKIDLPVIPQRSMTYSRSYSSSSPIEYATTGSGPQFNFLTTRDSS